MQAILRRTILPSLLATGCMAPGEDDAVADTDLSGDDTDAEDSDTDGVPDTDPATDTDTDAVHDDTDLPVRVLWEGAGPATFAEYSTWGPPMRIDCEGTATVSLRAPAHGFGLVTGTFVCTGSAQTTRALDGIWSTATGEIHGTVWTGEIDDVTTPGMVHGEYHGFSVPPHVQMDFSFDATTVP